MFVEANKKEAEGEQKERDREMRWDQEFNKKKRDINSEW